MGSIADLFLTRKGGATRLAKALDGKTSSGECHAGVDWTGQCQRSRGKNSGQRDQ